MGALATKAAEQRLVTSRPRGHRPSLRAAGNLDAQRLLRAGAIRAKLRVDVPGDAHELEADRIADRVMAATGSCCPSCVAEHRPSAARGPMALPTPGQPLSPSTRAFFELRLGVRLGDVRVHADTGAAQSAEAISARAFTSGRDIVFGRGEFAPESPRGRRLLAHELAHVVQQRRGDATPSVQRQKTTGELNWEQMRHSGPVDWKPGMQAIVLQDRTSPTGTVKAGTRVEVVANNGFGSIQVQTVDPKARGKEPLHVEDIRLQPIGQLLAAATDAPLAPKTRFEVQIIDVMTAESMGVDPRTLPERTAVPLDTAQRLVPGVGVGWAGAPWPAFPLPANTTGVQWTQSSFGHFSQFSNVAGRPIMGGYRSFGLMHMWQGVHSMFTGRPWTAPVPGGYFNDWWFRMMSPESQTMVYRQGSPQHAQLVAELIARGSYAEPYTFPPGAPGVKCTNCITAPRTEAFAALGGRPVVVTPDGVFDITEFGRAEPADPFTTEQAGRGRTMREWLKNPTVQTPTGQIETLGTTKPPASTVWGTRGVFVIRAGGVVMLVYGGYKTWERLEEAEGTPAYNRVVAQETGSWVGGIIGGALGAAAAGAVLCLPSGPGAFACAAGGFVVGLVGGALGSMAGAMGADYLYERAQGAAATASEVFEPMIERAIWGSTPIPAMGYYPPQQFGENPVEYEEQRDRYMRSQSPSGRGF